MWASQTFGEHRVGRIRLADERTAWCWYINPGMPVPAWGNGANTSLDAAKVAFRTAFERFAAQTTDDQWGRCFEHA
jgi:hypothetical protein